MKTLIVIVVLLISGTVVTDQIQTHIMKQQQAQLQNLQVQADKIAKSQLDQENRIKQLEQEYKDSLSFGSYYDYILDSGWSSEGHRVCASRDYKRGTMLKVTNLSNMKSVECLVTDYGPDENIFPERKIDLSSYAFSLISSLQKGVIPVSIQKVK